MTVTPAGRHAAGAFDVLVVGAGPVGLTTAILLAQRGWHVAVLERWADPYPMPRAVHFDDETARILAQSITADTLRPLGEPADNYDWQNADGETLLRLDWSGPGRSGWPTATMFYQPTLEEALEKRASELESLEVRRGHEVVQLADRGDTVELVAKGLAGEQVSFTAGWLIGCDGANSFVRGHMSTTMTDLGFFYDWLIVDVVPHVARTWTPINLQICDPAGPTTVVSGGPGRRRWEFMRRPDESVEELNNEDRAWRLLAPWDITPDNATLERHAVYTFQARWADKWRDGRLLLAGDAAHLMPPFAGQGMCSGIRDAANLTWKLDLVMRGIAPDSLLDTYTAERRSHVQHAIGLSIELGKVICVTDHEAASQRDAFMLSKGGDPAQILPPLPPPMLTEGLLHRGPDGTPASAAGVLSVQGRVSYRGATGLIDDVIGPGALIATSIDPYQLLPEGQLNFFRDIGGHVVQLVASTASPSSVSDHMAVDIDDTYLPSLAAEGQVGLVVRPDNYVFGAAADPAELVDVVGDFQCQLTTASTRVEESSLAHHRNRNQEAGTGSPLGLTLPVPACSG